MVLCKKFGGSVSSRRERARFSVLLPVLLLFCWYGGGAGVVQLVAQTDSAASFNLQDSLEKFEFTPVEDDSTEAVKKSLETDATESGTTESGATASATTDSSTTEPSTTESSTTESSTTESSTTESGTTASATTEFAMTASDTTAFGAAEADTTASATTASDTTAFGAAEADTITSATIASGPTESAATESGAVASASLETGSITSSVVAEAMTPPLPLDHALRDDERQALTAQSVTLYASYNAWLRKELAEIDATLCPLRDLAEELGLTDTVATATLLELARHNHRLREIRYELYALAFAGMLGPPDAWPQPFIWDSLPLFSHPAFEITALRLRAAFLNDRLRRIEIVEQKLVEEVKLGEPAH